MPSNSHSGLGRWLIGDGRERHQVGLSGRRFAPTLLAGKRLSAPVDVWTASLARSNGCSGAEALSPPFAKPPDYPTQLVDYWHSVRGLCHRGIVRASLFRQSPAPPVTRFASGLQIGSWTLTEAVEDMGTPVECVYPVLGADDIGACRPCSISESTPCQLLRSATESQHPLSC